MRTPLAVVLTLLSSQAAAYVRPTTSNGTPLRWMHTDCIQYRIHASGSADLQDGSDIAAARRALDAWRQVTGHCAYIRFEPLPETAAALPSFDGTGPNENVIYWHEQDWPHDPSTVVMPTLFFVDKAGDVDDGRILDADIEGNGAYFTFSVGGQSGTADIENALMQALGHALGLGDNCFQYAPGSIPLPVDHAGSPIPQCSELAGSSDPAHQLLRDATMYPFADPGETKKRTPEADDIAGVCAIYPTGSATGVCQGVDLTPVPDGGPVGPPAADGGATEPPARGCSCEVATQRVEGWLLLAVSLLLLGRFRG